MTSSSRQSRLICAAVLTAAVLLAGCVSREHQGLSSTTTLPLKERMRQDAHSKVGASCEADADCEIPFKYAVLSHCPYGVACIEGGCAVVCAVAWHDPNESVTHLVPCSQDTDCDCSQTFTVGLKECACHDGSCVAVAARSPSDTDF